MPKKRNAFYYYMLQFREEQRSNGINFESMHEVCAAAGACWPHEPHSVKARFQAIARKNTGTGGPMAHIQRKERVKQDWELSERKEIKKFVYSALLDERLLKEDLYIMDVNYYCEWGSKYYIGEFSIVRFNLEEGLKDSYHEIVEPGRIPTGYHYDVKLSSIDLGLPLPDDRASTSDYLHIFANLMTFLKWQRDTLPLIFSFADKVAPVTSFIHQLCRRAGEDETPFRVYKAYKLFYFMYNSLHLERGFLKDNNAMLKLYRDPFKYIPGLGCEMHELSDRARKCTTSRMKRLAYTIMASCCPLRGLPMIEGRHRPDEPDYQYLRTKARPADGTMFMAALTRPPLRDLACAGGSQSMQPSGSAGERMRPGPETGAIPKVMQMRRRETPVRPATAEEVSSPPVAHFAQMRIRNTPLMPSTPAEETLPFPRLPVIRGRAASANLDEPLLPEGER